MFKSLRLLSLLGIMTTGWMFSIADSRADCHCHCTANQKLLKDLGWVKSDSECDLRCTTISPAHRCGQF